MKKLTLIVSFMGLLAASAPAQLQIASLSNNGLLTWTNSFTNGVYSVDWANAVGGNPAWQQSWVSLNYIAPTSSTTTVPVPMFFRVRCLTNGLFYPMTVGNTATFQVSNAVSGVWTQKAQTLGVLTIPSLTNAYNQYFLGHVWDSSGTNVWMWRSTDRAFYLAPSVDINEQLKWTNGPVGTVFSYNDGQANVSTIISTTTTVSVPAGTYNNCLVFSNRCAACSDQTPYFIEYVKPGVGLVYWEDYWGTPNPPNIYRLQSIQKN